MLLGKNCRGTEQGSLPAVQNTFHHGTESNFCFSEANIPAQKPVHGNRGFHILFDFKCTAQLVIGFRIRKVFLKFTLPLTVRSKGITRSAETVGIESYQPFCHSFCCLFCTRTPLFPFNTAHFGKFDRNIFCCCGILGYEIKLCGRDIQNICPGIYNFNIILVISVHLHTDDTGEAADAMGFMDDVVTDGQIRIGIDSLTACGKLSLRGGLFPAADQLRVTQNSELQAWIFHSGRYGADVNGAFAGGRQHLIIRGKQSRDIMFVEERTENVCTARISGQNGKRAACFQKLSGIVGRCLRIAGVGRQLLGGDTQKSARSNRCSPDCESVRHIEREIVKTVQQSIKGKEKGILLGGNQAAATELPDILGKPFGIFTGSFRTAGRLIQKHDSIFRNIGGSGSHGI